jgi:hypothetical protein
MNSRRKCVSNNNYYQLESVMGLPNDIHSTTMGASIEAGMMGKEPSNQLALKYCLLIAFFTSKVVPFPIRLTQLYFLEVSDLSPLQQYTAGRFSSDEARCYRITTFIGVSGRGEHPPTTGVLKSEKPPVKALIR